MNVKGDMIMSTLEIDQVQEAEKTLLNEPNSAHAWDFMRLLKSWKNEPGLRKTPETQALIDRLIAEFGDQYKE